MSASLHSFVERLIWHVCQALEEAKQARKGLCRLVVWALMGLGGVLTLAMVVMNIQGIVSIGTALLDVLILVAGLAVVLAAVRFLGFGKALVLAGVLLVGPMLLSSVHSVSGLLPVILLLAAMGAITCSGRKEKP